VVLLWEPHQLFQASFQLSFFVVLSIALFLPPLERLRDRWLALDPMLAPEVIPLGRRLGRAAARLLLTTLATSLAAWLGALPLTMFYFHIFTPVTLLANLVIVPLASLALCCNLGSLLCGAWWPFVSELFNHSAWFLMTAMMKFCQGIIEIPAAFSFVSAPGPFTFLVYYGLLIGFLSGWLWQRERRARTAAAILVIACYYVGNWMTNRTRAELTVLPLDGGHAVYFDAAGKSQDWLIDCGNTNSAEWITQPFLRAHGVNRLPRLMLTHGDLKQIGGAELIASEFACHDIYASSLRFRSSAYRGILSDLQRAPYEVIPIHRGDEVALWEILHPDKSDKPSQADDGALVCRGEIHGVKLLLLSDLGREAQDLLLTRYRDQLQVDLVIAGLPEQSEPLCEALLDATRPRAIIVADSQLPANARASEQLKARLLGRKILVLSTRDVGAVTVVFSPQDCRLMTASGEIHRLQDLPAMTIPPATDQTMDLDER